MTLPKGVYALLIDVEEDLNLSVGKLGDVHIQEGSWVYVGSALGPSSNSLENRINRHFSTEKTIHWHIDYLLQYAIISNAVFARTEEPKECEISIAIQKSGSFIFGPRGFGSSDCKKKCGTHLYRYKREQNLLRTIKDLFDKKGLVPKIHVN